MLPGIGPKTLEKLTRLGIQTPRDLIFHFPHRYLDFSHVKKIKDLQPEQASTVTGQLLSFQNIYTRSHKNIQKAKIRDNTGTLDLIWFNQPYLSRNFVVGQTYSFAGTVSLYQNKFTIIAPVSGDFHTGKIIPIYPETKNLTSNWFRRTIQTNLNTLLVNIPDPLPPEILQEYNLPPIDIALKNIHLPSDSALLDRSRLRLSIDEALSLQAQSFLLKQEILSKSARCQFNITPKIQQKLIDFISSLPFTLTSSQKLAWSEIQSDLLLARPCNRLLVGDVGTGKTVLAMLSAILASENKALSLILAPTEILAQQHFRNFKKFLPDYPVKLLTGKQKISAIKPNTIIIATHAAIYQKQKFINQIGLLVVDEQHRFGVAQRSFLSDLLHPPHTLTMTATPIPRSISLTFLGHLDLSLLEFPPSYKLPIKTFLIPPSKIADCYKWLEHQINQTRQQAFIVCPFIEDSTDMSAVKSAVTEFAKLKTIFPKLKLELVHGKIKSADREVIFKKFADRKVDILVTTPIIEVGIDFPNATVIIIQSADRFGLSQLHQLRGRVGRGVDQSYCYLFTESQNSKSLDRLKFLSDHTDGKTIAEYDLKTRGPGEVFSTIQHGFPSLKIADISDTKLIDLSQKILRSIMDQNPSFDLTSLVQTPPKITAITS